VTGPELEEIGLASTPDAGEAAWRDLRKTSDVARAAAASLLGRRETGRAAAEALERAAFALCFAADDRAEGVRAFLERREPRFHDTAGTVPDDRPAIPGEVPGRNPS
jgi:enoyl-CoA hydratase/carnithine racemase